jgi:hypothetical protein
MEISKETKFTLSTETLVTIGITLVSVTGFYFSLKAEVAQAMQEPAPVISREEYDLKDNAIRSEIMNNRDLIQKNFKKLETIEERLYELKR